MKVPTFHIICKHKTPRLEYVVDFIFRQVLGCEVIVSTEENRDADLKISYGTSYGDGAFSMYSSGLLSETGVRKEWLELLTRQSATEWFTEKGGTERFDLDQDVFALVFFFLSRYEEYLPFKGDSLGRFCAADSLAFQKGILQIPVVESAIQLLKDKLTKRYNILWPASVQEFLVRPTIDVDQIWAYHRKGWKNMAASAVALVKGDISEIKHRWQAWWNVEKDPFHTWALLDDIHSECVTRPVYFILTAPEQSELDKNHPPSDPEVQRQLRQLAEKHQVGIHPSSRCRANGNLLIREKAILENIIEKTVSLSRMHYLLFRLPDTYRMLQEGGITHDYTMGFHDALGYRAGTGFDFFWYDLKTEKQTGLRITPFQLMDVTLKVHLKLQTFQAMKHIQSIADTARNYNSPLTVVWHNSSFYDRHGWEGWGEVYRSVFVDSFQTL